MEIWKDITGFEGFYQVSSDGAVRSVYPFPKLFKLKPHKNGYVYVGLSKKGQCKHHRVHRLVASTFISNSLGKPYVNHKNGIKSDNRVINLEWVTASENDNHAYATGLRRSPRAWEGKTGSAHNRSRKVNMFTLSGDLVRSFHNVTQAETELKISHQNISNVCAGKRKSAGGYKWQYHE